MASFGMARGGGESASSSTIDASTPWVAAADGNLMLLQTSLQTLNLPLTCADENGYTLLQAAASYSHLDILQWLVDTFSKQNSSSNTFERLAWINAVDKEGDSALHYASTRQAAQFLLQHGIDPNIRNVEGMTALESKRAELDESMQDDDENGDDDGEPDEDIVQLKQVIEYLTNTLNSNSSSNPQ